MTRFFVWDTETTGAGPEDRPCEVAFVELDANMQRVGQRGSLIDPQRPISAAASGVNGITDEMVAGAPTIDEWFEILAGRMPEYGEPYTPPIEGAEMVFIAHKAVFDRKMLGPIFQRYGIRIAEEMCTLLMARRYLPNAENHKLATLMHQYGLAQGEKHRASGDVDTTVSLIEFVLDLTGMTLPQMVAALQKPQVLPCIPFGKWKDVPIRQVDPSYCAWALGVRGYEKKGPGMRDLDKDLEFTLRERAFERI